MAAARRSASRQGAQGRGWLCALTAGCLALLIPASTAAPSSGGVGEYEYEYDALPREHLARFGRAVDTVIQHVPAHTPPEPATASTFVQRIPRGAQSAQPAQPAAELAPPARMEGAGKGLPKEQAPQVPAAVPEAQVVKEWEAAEEAIARRLQGTPTLTAISSPASSPTTSPTLTSSSPASSPTTSPTLTSSSPASSTATSSSVSTTSSSPVSVTATPPASEDMETANFFWGLGPVYPHLYVFQRVPHLVPLRGWSPYHAYILTHPDS